MEPNYKLEVFSSEGCLAISRENGQDLLHLSRVDRETASDDAAEPGWVPMTDEEHQAIIDRLVAAFEREPDKPKREPQERFQIHTFDRYGLDGVTFEFCVVDHEQVGSDGERFIVGTYTDRAVAEEVRGALIAVQPPTQEREPDKFDTYIVEGRKLIELHPDFSEGDLAAPGAGDDTDPGGFENVWTAACDQIATILHGVFGRKPSRDCHDQANALLGQALRCWEGDYEDMGTRDRWSEALKEMGGYRHAD